MTRTVRKKFFPVVFIFLVSAIFSSILTAQENQYLLTKEQSTKLYHKLLTTLWEKEIKTFYSPETHAWHGGPAASAPTPEQVKDLWPNPVGYGSIIADDALYEGTLLPALLELYKITDDSKLVPMINDTWLGLKAIGTAHGVRGFVPRGICPGDGKSIYITSSRDQVTHFVDALWQYYHSKFAAGDSKKLIVRLLTDLADVMHEQVIEENDYSFLRADGTKDPRGLHKMWHVYSHEAARLPMIYAAAFDVTGDQKYAGYYNEYATEAIKQSRELKTKPMREVNSWVPTYSFYQMQCSLALMFHLEKEPGLKSEILKAMTEASDFSTARIDRVVNQWGKRDIAELIMAWTMTRDLKLNDTQKKALAKTFTEWLEKKNSDGPAETIHVLGAYSKACLNGYVPKPEK